MRINEQVVFSLLLYICSQARASFQKAENELAAEFYKTIARSQRKNPNILFIAVINSASELVKKSFLLRTHSNALPRRMI